MGHLRRVVVECRSRAISYQTSTDRNLEECPSCNLPLKGDRARGCKVRNV